MVEGNVPVPELFLDGTEAPYHDVLPFTSSILGIPGRNLLPVISPRSNHRTVPFVRLRVAYQYYGKHIRFRGRTLPTSLCALPVRDALPGVHSLRGSVVNVLLAGTTLSAGKVANSGLHFGIVDGCHEIGCGSGNDTFLNAFPRGHQV